MKLFIVAVGHKMPNWVEAAIKDYVKRMPKDSPIIIKELKPDINPAKEAVKILDHIPKNSYVIGLDERGKDLNTQQMSQEFADWQQMGKDIYLIIGGADGLDLTLKQSCQALWRLSSLTLPHALARLLLVEQLYRSWTILQNHPYHRE
jgi:23S rRNA (pseudouridine1915-N3)-methyltransferase